MSYRNVAWRPLCLVLAVMASLSGEEDTLWAAESEGGRLGSELRTVQDTTVKASEAGFNRNYVQVSLPRGCKLTVFFDVTVGDKYAPKLSRRVRYHAKKKQKEIRLVCGTFDPDTLSPEKSQHLKLLGPAPEFKQWIQLDSKNPRWISTSHPATLRSGREQKIAEMKVGVPGGATDGYDSSHTEHLLNVVLNVKLEKMSDKEIESASGGITVLPVRPPAEDGGRRRTATGSTSTYGK